MIASSPLIGLWRNDRAFRVGAILGAAAAAPATLYLGVIWGTFGGGWGEAYLGAIGVPLGILASLVLLSGGGTLAAAAVGGLISSSFGRLVRHVKRAERR